MRIAACMLLAIALGDAHAEYGNADVQPELAATHARLGGNWPVFAATVVEGGGVKASNKNPPSVVLDVAEEFPSQRYAPGRVKIGKQAATFQVIGGSPAEAERDFETPLNGTRIIAFGDARGPLVVYADMIFADTPRNRARVLAGKQPAASESWQAPLFWGSLAIAFVAVFLAWYRVGFGGIALGASVILWLAYEAVLPQKADYIRLDLVLLFPVFIAAAVSLAVSAAIKRKPWKDPDLP